jgi:hypothetical protein
MRRATGLIGRSRRRWVECCVVINMMGSASEAGQLLKPPRASTTTASLSSRIDENQLSTLACQHTSLIISVTARDEAVAKPRFATALRR